MGEKYFLEERYNKEIELYEKEGSFYDHDVQDLLIATFYKKEEAQKICDLLNENQYKVVAEKLLETLIQINKALGSENPENWTKEAILERIRELQEKIK